MQGLLPLQASCSVFVPNLEEISLEPELTKPKPITLSLVPPRFEMSLGMTSRTKAS